MALLHKFYDELDTVVGHPIGISKTDMNFAAVHANFGNLMHFSNVIGDLAVSAPTTLGLNNPLCNDTFVQLLKGGLTTIIEVLMSLAVVIAVIGIVIGGLMRATAWGSDQRIASSNKTISSSIIGLIIVLLAAALGSAVPTWFGLQSKTCALTPPTQYNQSSPSTTDSSSGTSGTPANIQPSSNANQVANLPTNQVANSPADQESHQAPTPTPIPTPLPAPQTVLDLTFQSSNHYADLTKEGSLDWKQWGLYTASDVNHKAGVKPQISDITFVGNGHVGTDQINPINLTWSDGAPTQRMTNGVGAVYTTGLKNGFLITVPASATPRTLRVYIGASLARGRFVASLNGMTRVDASLDVTHDPTHLADTAVYTIKYSTNVPGEQMSIVYTNMQSNGESAYVMLEAATLQ